MNDSLLTKAKIEGAMGQALKKLDKLMEDFVDDFPFASSVDGVYAPDPAGNRGGWTQCFYTGMLALAYEYTKDKKYLDRLEHLLPTFFNRVDNMIGMGDHDIGFNFTLSCVAAYKATGNELYKEKALKAAHVLRNRFREKGQFIQLAGEADCAEPLLYRFIIDTLMNLHLLFWATEASGNSEYAEKAYAHFNTAMETLIREDGSTYQNFYMDQETGARLRGGTKQGLSDESCWARGQSWGVAGIPFVYSYKKNDDVMDKYYLITDYYLDHLPKDKVAYWDLFYTDPSEEPRDSSAAAIGVCGLNEAVKIMPLDDAHKERYAKAADEILNSLIDSYTTKDDEKSNGLLKHATYYYAGKLGIDECNIYGDYFYMEALMRYLNPDWKKYW